MNLFESHVFTELHSLTEGIEGPACDQEGNIYAVNYAKQGTIGKITPQGESSIFVELPNGSIGNGICFNYFGDMFIADYVNHNILKVDMQTREIYIFAHESRMHQPNDIAIVHDGIIFASDPDWEANTGKLWRININ